MMQIVQESRGESQGVDNAVQETCVAKVTESCYRGAANPRVTAWTFICRTLVVTISWQVSVEHGRTYHNQSTYTKSKDNQTPYESMVIRTFIQTLMQQFTYTRRTKLSPKLYIYVLFMATHHTA
jgi:hypothetical protein